MKLVVYSKSLRNQVVLPFIKGQKMSVVIDETNIAVSAEAHFGEAFWDDFITPLATNFGEHTQRRGLIPDPLILCLVV